MIFHGPSINDSTVSSIITLFIRFNYLVMHKKYGSVQAKLSYFVSDGLFFKLSIKLNILSFDCVIMQKSLLFGKIEN